METYREFLDRINSFEKKAINFGNEYFKCNPTVLQKVNSDNSFKKFYGDTVVFALDGIIKKALAGYVDILHGTAPQCFCRKLSADTFHLTLHDLSNSAALQDIRQELTENQSRVTELSEEVKKHGNIKIKMNSNGVFNMVDTSLVLGMYPASEDDYYRLTELYAVFDKVKKLNYPFTPHITLAYYNVNGFDLPSANALKNTIRRLNENEIETELKIDDLYYQKFESMNDYTDIFRFTK